MPFLRGTVNFESVLTFNGILWISLAFGFYFKRNTSATTCLLTKMYCIIVCALNIVHSINIQDPLSSEPYYFAAILYDVTIVTEISANVLISLITETETFMKFLSNLAANPLSTLHKKHSCYVSYFIIFLAIVVELVIFSCTGSEEFSAEYFAYTFKDFSCFFSRIPLIYVLDNYRQTVQVTCKLLNANLKSKQMNDAEKIKHVKNFIDAYIKISKNLNSTIKIMRVKTIIAYGCDFLKLISFVYYFNLSSTMEPVVFVSWCTELFIALTLLCFPSCLMELSNKDLDDMKYNLADQILLYKDKNLRNAIYDALDYMDAWSFKYTMWNQFPLNLNLVMVYFHLCISYVVALLQFKY